MPAGLTPTILIVAVIVAVAVIAGYLWWAWGAKFFPFS